MILISANSLDRSNRESGGFPLISSRFTKRLSLFKPSYLPPLKFVDIVRVAQIALSGVSVFAINIDEDVGVSPSTKHVAGKDTHFVGVDCQTIEGINYKHLLILYVALETIKTDQDVLNINTEYKEMKRI